MSYPKAIYTMSFTEFMKLWKDTESYQRFIAEMTEDFTSHGMNSDFMQSYWDTIYNRWHEYEIAGETVYEQSDFIITTYREHKAYHLERLELYYRKNLDKPTFTQMLSRETSTEGSNSRSGSKSSSGSNEGEQHNKSVQVDLPNKLIDPQDIYSYPSDGDKSDNTSTNSYSDSEENQENGESSSSTTYTDKSKFYEVYERALRSCTDIMLELAADYSDCFIHIF